ncbi:MAG: RNA polymerase factor sigma-54 [Candidatus Marinimicrobia bacterium]|nr:RNA polymerase factor sigma-54 [Candidatus Neomarinimicrobiota bacterium]MBL7060157.1 RNA polymerase factor sigma-54 [Candidatus Neomarinimicrobiota bacterium]
MSKLSQRLSQKQILSPQQILQAKLLQLNNVSLEEAILTELETNPVLDQEETDKEEKDERQDNVLELSGDDDEYEREIYIPQRKETIERPQAEEQDFIETIIKQLDDYNLSEGDKVVAEEILWNVDDRGYLATEMLLIADRFNRSEEEIKPILHLVQRLDPPGIAARDLRECLLIQLDNQKDSCAYKVIDQCYDLFSNKRFETIEKRLQCPEDELSNAMKIISHLNPRPGEGIRFTKDEIVVPDLIVRKDNKKWVVQVNDSGMPELKVNPDYMAMMEERQHIGTDARHFIKKRLDSAQWFMDAIRQRRNTMTRVMHSIIQRQPGFFNGNIHDLNPMKLQDVAEDIKMDISTVSRSTRGKYADTPFGIFELKYFFTDRITLNDGREVSNHAIKRRLKGIVDSEDKHSPLNDETLVERLKEVSFPIARRTVAKYREQMNIPVARLRRTL